MKGHHVMDLPTDKKFTFTLNGIVCCLSLTADWRQSLKEQPPSPKSQEPRNETMPTKDLIEICTPHCTTY